MSDLIHLRLGESLKKDLNEIKELGYYTTITDFIKEAVRLHLFEIKRIHAYNSLARLRGSKKELEMKKLNEFTDEEQSNIFREYGKLFRKIR